MGAETFRGGQTAETKGAHGHLVVGVELRGQAATTGFASTHQSDARVRAGLARTDGHLHRPVAGDSDLAEAIKVLPEPTRA